MEVQVIGVRSQLQTDRRRLCRDGSSMIGSTPQFLLSTDRYGHSSFSRHSSPQGSQAKHLIIGGSRPEALSSSSKHILLR